MRYLQDEFILVPTTTTADATINTWHMVGQPLPPELRGSGAATVPDEDDDWLENP
jgi:hypothetical protein